MSTDRELLELAAKAAGHGLPGPEDTDEIGRQYVYSLGLWVNFPWGFDWWAPLTDDGDEARLEGMLCFDVMWGMASVTVDSCTERYNDHGGDKQKARRFAGVRAAAEIGKAMP